MKKNILQIMPYFPPHIGGVERVSEEIFSKWTYGKSLIFSGNSCQKSVVYNDKVDNKRKYFFDSVDIVDNFPFPKLWTTDFWKELKKIRKILKEDDFVIITHTRFFFSSFMGGMLAKIYKKKWIHIEHGSGYVVSGKKYVDICAYMYDRVFGKFVLKRANKVLAISGASKDFIVTEFKRKDVEIFYRGMDFFPINQKRKESSEIRFVYIGRITKLKGIDVLLRACAQLDEKYQAFLDIIGDGDERKNLERLSNELGISSKINFLGGMKRENVWKYLGENRSICINPSYQEGMPTTVIEALVGKNVCIASDVGGTREISKHEDLVLFESGNIEQLSQKMLNTYKKFELLEGKSYEHMKNTFSWNKNILELYNLV